MSAMRAEPQIFYGHVTGAYILGCKWPLNLEWVKPYGFVYTMWLYNLKLNDAIILLNPPPLILDPPPHD
jgi:hypothetical protein